MGDMGEVFREWDECKRLRREQNMEEFDPSGWTKRTDYHYQRIVADRLLDYWPSKKKWMYDGKVSTGNVYEFIKAREAKTDGI